MSAEQYKPASRYDVEKHSFKNIQQRVGGPNSLKTLEQEGLVVEDTNGSFKDVTRVKVSNGNGGTSVDVPVRPIRVTNNPGQPTEEKFTVFKPANQKQRTDTDSPFQRLIQGNETIPDRLNIIREAYNARNGA